MRRFMLVLCLLSIVLCPLSAQSQLTYELKVGTTGENALLAQFPENYEGEKVNVRERTNGTSTLIWTMHR